MTLRQAIVVSPHFPPSTVAGVHRARHLAKHLPAAGWKPIVVCVDEAQHEDRLDPELAALLPKGLDIVKVGAAPARLTRPLGVGDISLRAWTNLKQALFRLIQEKAADAVLITGSPFYPMLMAPEIRRRFGVPVVLDFQDPWVSAWGVGQPPFSKAGIVHRLAVSLEPRALHGADFITSVSDMQNDQMSSRYRWLDRDRMAGIPIGGDPEDFAAMRERSSDANRAFLEPGPVHLSYVGTFLPRSGPLVRTLFRAFARLRLAEPMLAGRIRMNFIGTSNQTHENGACSVLPIAEEEGVANSVREVPQRQPYLAALAVLAQSNGLLLIGSDEPHYTASKIYPALMSGRPFLSLFHQASSAHAILSAAGGGMALAFETPNQLSLLESEIAQGLRRLALRPESFGSADPVAYAPFEARNIARRFANIFDQLADRRAA